MKVGERKKCLKRERKKKTSLEEKIEIFRF